MSDAVKYFQKNGLQASKELVGMGFGFVSLEGDLSFHTEQLKQLVESHELVIVWRMPESWRDDYDGDKLGLDGARMYLDMHGNHELVGEKLERFKQAIADVEECEEVS